MGQKVRILGQIVLNREDARLKSDGRVKVALAYGPRGPMLMAIWPLKGHLNIRFSGLT